MYVCVNYLCDLTDGWSVLRVLPSNTSVNIFDGTFTKKETHVLDFIDYFTYVDTFLLYFLMIID